METIQTIINLSYGDLYQYGLVETNSMIRREKTAKVYEIVTLYIIIRYKYELSGVHKHIINHIPSMNNITSRKLCKYMIYYIINVHFHLLSFTTRIVHIYLSGVNKYITGLMSG